MTETLLHPFLEGLRMAASMAWQTWWALVLGFTIAGAVEAFAREERMSRLLGGSGPREVALATFFGAVSSSCSFGAVATTKSLFKKGASAAASLGAFQFASTNLVIELGLVMWVLLGWQFVAANFVSGLLLIVLLALTYRFLVPPSWIEEARAHVRAVEGVRDPVCGMEVDPEADDTVRLDEDGQTVWFCSAGCRDRFREGGAEDPWARLTTREGWVEASRAALGEWGMLWKEILAGFLIAGWIAAFVPREAWTALFSVAPEGTLADVALSCVVGVIVGVVTFVCSVGNVPFALLLWRNGIAFGAVMSFIFADLIVPHIVHAYRRYYGTRMAATIFAATFACAVVAGVAIHYVWTWAGLVPASGELGGTAPEGHAVWLNAVFTGVFLLQLRVARGSGD